MHLSQLDSVSGTSSKIFRRHGDINPVGLILSSATTILAEKRVDIKRLLSQDILRWRDLNKNQTSVVCISNPERRI